MHVMKHGWKLLGGEDLDFVEFKAYLQQHELYEDFFEPRVSIQDLEEEITGRGLLSGLKFLMHGPHTDKNPELFIQERFPTWSDHFNDKNSVGVLTSQLRAMGLLVHKDLLKKYCYENFFNKSYVSTDVW